YFGAEVNDRAALIRFEDEQQQVEAKRVIQRALGNTFIVALNLAPTTPGWLSAMGAEPMKLGLDLRGGVHFLMEVDTASVVEKRQEISADEMKQKLRNASTRYSAIDVTPENIIEARFRTAELRSSALRELRGDYPALLFNEGNAGSDFTFTGELS